MIEIIRNKCVLLEPRLHRKHFFFRKKKESPSLSYINCYSRFFPGQKRHAGMTPGVPGRTLSSEEERHFTMYQLPASPMHLLLVSTVWSSCHKAKRPRKNVNNWIIRNHDFSKAVKKEYVLTLSQNA